MSWGSRCAEHWRVEDGERWEGRKVVLPALGVPIPSSSDWAVKDCSSPAHVARQCGTVSVTAKTVAVGTILAPPLS